MIEVGRGVGGGVRGGGVKWEDSGASMLETSAISPQCGFYSSVGRALHRERKGRGFESLSKPEFFQVFFPVVLWLHSQLSFFQYAQV